MEEKVLRDISNKLSALIGLLAEEKTKDMNAEYKVDYLNKLGLERNIIAVICGIKEKSVAETLSRIKGKGKKSEQRKSKN